MENVHIIKWGKVVKINIFRCTAAQCSLSFFLRKKTERTIVKSYKNNIQQLVNHQRWYLKTLEIKRFRLNWAYCCSRYGETNYKEPRRCTASKTSTTGKTKRNWLCMYEWSSESDRPPATVAACTLRQQNKPVSIRRAARSHCCIALHIRLIRMSTNFHLVCKQTKCTRKFNKVFLLF